MDGAGAIRRFVHITIPQLKTVSLTLIFVHIIWTAINLAFIWVMTQGGLLNASETLTRSCSAAMRSKISMAAPRARLR
jgi:multiple sugar transport system permease protein